MRKLNDKRARRFDAIWTSFSSELSNYDNWIYAINNINTDGVACARCRRAWIASVCCPYPSRQPITSEFKSILFECESFGSLLAHLALKPHPSLHQSHCRVCAGIINWSCLLASARFPGSWGAPAWTRRPARRQVLQPVDGWSPFRTIHGLLNSCKHRRIESCSPWHARWYVSH